MKKIIFIFFVFFTLTACDDSNRLLYTDLGHPVIWGSTYIPISVLYDKNFEENYIYSIEIAVIEINSIFGELFLPPFAGERPKRGHAYTSMLFIWLYDNDNASVLATTSHNVESDRVSVASADIRIRAEIGPELLIYVFSHELGHVIGLAHDSNQKSIMYPFINGDIHFKERIWDPGDIDLIRSLYF